ncbi:alpha/beta fold hydrolase [Agreia sp.]|uniref:alpha/beta fold hydrolase n=1 Tax=Agreia sp. TaxID=1872416 RepID=UPI0035BC944F
MNASAGQTQYADIAGGRIAYDVIGEGPLVVLSPGMADLRNTYRFLAPLLAEAGYRVASVDLRGHGDSSAGWDSYDVADTGSDLVEIIRQLGGPAVLVGQSFSAGAATIAAASNPELVTAVVEIAPFTRPPKFSLGAMLRDGTYRRGALLLAQVALAGSVAAWGKYLGVAYPGQKPRDWDSYLAAVLSNLSEPDRMKAARGMINASKAEAGARLADVKRPVLVLMGSKDSDFANPQAEAAAIVDLLPSGVGRYQMIEGAGHYPHAQYPQAVADAILPFLADHAPASR